MEVHFTPEQEAQLTQIADRSGTDTERLVMKVVADYLEREISGSLPRFKRDSKRRSEGNSSKRKKWTPALKRC